MDERPVLAPLPEEERIQVMDVLRGFALCGILLMNIEAMVGPLAAATTGLDPALRGADRWVDAAIYLLVQGKFYPLFSLLFGMGFAVMFLRARAGGRPFLALYLRRTVALLAIGLAHAVLVWSGDILVTYALVAFVLLLFFRNTDQGWLPGLGIVFMLLPPLVFVLLGTLGTLAASVPGAAAAMQDDIAMQVADLQAVLDAQRHAQGSGSYAEAVAQRWDDLAGSMVSLLFWAWQVLGLFLLGSWFVRSGAIARPAQFPRLYARLRQVALPVGLGMTLLSFWLAPTIEPVMVDLRAGLALALAMVGGVLMSLGYLAWIVRARQSPGLAARLDWLAPAGRMALSNYLLQSVLCTFLFSGYGLGGFEKLDRAWQLPFVLTLFALQVLASHWWLERFRFGPVEWLWRAATYLRLPAMRQ